MERGHAIAVITSAACLLAAAPLCAQERTLAAPPAGVQTSREHGIAFVTVNPSGQAVDWFKGGVVAHSFESFAAEPAGIDVSG